MSHIDRKEVGLMGARENKQLLQSVFAELAQGNGKPFVAAMAEDFCWQAIGTTGVVATVSRQAGGDERVAAAAVRAVRRPVHEHGDSHDRGG
jgi:ketosteroid isomerase-like protein